MEIEAKYIDSREEWLRWRLQDVTGTDIGALAGVDKYRSPRAVFEEKTKHWVDDTDNDVLRRGRWMEAAVIEAVKEHHPDWEIERPGVYLRAPEHRLGGTPDARAWATKGGDLISLECKVVLRSIFEEDWTDGPPLKTQLQNLSNTMLENASIGLVPVLVQDFASIEYREYWVERHAQAEDNILKLAADFWARVEANDPPDFDFSQDAELVRRLYAKPERPSVDLSMNNRIDFLCEEYEAWKARKSRVDGAYEEIKSEIRALVGDAERGVHPEWVIDNPVVNMPERTLPASSHRRLNVRRKTKKQKEKEAKAV